MKHFYLLIFILLSFNYSFSQLDSIFWFVAPEVAQSHGDRPIVFRFATLNNPATITVEQPANPSFPAQTFNMSANSAQTLDVTNWIDMVENKPADLTLNFGFRITSSSAITAYYEVVTSCNCNPDIFALKGQNALGTSFVTPFQNFTSNASYARNGFNIVATQNNTTITILPKQNIVGHNANIPFTITLNAGQTYYAEAVGQSANQHLGGSTIVSNKPVAVTISDDTASGQFWGGCADLMGDQIIPTNVVGKEYIVIKGYLNGPDKIYIVATANNTQISINGAVVTTINATQTYEYNLSAASVYIQTSEPAYCLHVSGFGCELGTAIVPPIVCTGSNTVAFVRSTTEFFAINLLVPAGGETSFLFNGNAGVINATSFNFVPGTSNQWMYAQIDASSLLTASQAARITNNSVKFHMGLIHGGSSSGCRYGYFSDFSLLKYKIEANSDLLCSGETISLNANNLPGATYTWTGPNGTTYSGNNISIPNAQVSNSGQYVVYGNLPDACQLLPDTMQITVIATPPLPEIFTNGPVCAGEQLKFWTVPNTYNFNWLNSTGNIISTTDTLFYNGNGTFIVYLQQYLNSCLSPINSDTSLIFGAPVITYNGPVEICGNLVNFSSTIQTDGTDLMSQIQWKRIPSDVVVATGFGASGVQSLNPPYNVEEFVAVLTTVNDCIATDTFSVTFYPFPTTDFIYSDLCDGQNLSFQSTAVWFGTPDPSDQMNYFWNFGNNSATISNPQATFPSPGQYDVTLTVTSNHGCLDSQTNPVILSPIPNVLVTSTPACLQQVDFEATINSGDLNISSVSWSFPEGKNGTTNPISHTFNQAGNANGTLQLFAQNNCIYDYPFTFTVVPKVEIDELVIPNVITVNADQLNDELTIDTLFDACFEFEMVIINRWGNEVGILKNGQATFSGKDQNGKELTPGIYFYRLTSTHGEKHGFLTILR